MRHSARSRPTTGSLTPATPTSAIADLIEVHLTRACFHDENESSTNSDTNRG